MIKLELRNLVMLLFMVRLLSGYVYYICLVWMVVCCISVFSYVTCLSTEYVILGFGVRFISFFGCVLFGFVVYLVL